MLVTCGNIRKHCQPSYRGKMTYAQIAKDYKKNCQAIENGYIRHFSATDKAVVRAVESEYPEGKRYPHQYRIPKSALREAKDLLETVKFNKGKSFDAIHELVKKAIEGVSGIGELIIYDIAHRIGASLRIKPQDVYLHCGTREGAKKLPGYKKGMKKMPLSLIPKELRHLGAEHLENCLCIYSKNLP